MKSLKDTKSKYKLPLDIRQEQLRFGKYLYLTLILVFLLVLFYVLFGHLFLLNGQGFVYSENTMVELEYDATVQQVAVKDGDYVKCGQLLFNFTSIELQRILNEFAIEMNNIRNSIHQNQFSSQYVRQNINQAQQYVDYSKDLKDQLAALRKRGLVDVIQIDPQAKRNFDATQDLINLQLEEKNLGVHKATLQNQLNDMQHRYDTLASYYNDGQYRSIVNGVVADLTIVPGRVLEKANPAMYIFYGKRYIYGYFDQGSWVQYKVNDHVLVRIPGHGYAKGSIVKILPITDKLPEEFQPRFKEKLRRQIVVIELRENDLLKNIPIMSTVIIYKPLFFSRYL